VPSFDQVAAWAAASGAWLNVEIKSGGTEERVIESLSRTAIGDRTFISSFTASIVRRIGEIDPQIRRWLLVDRWDLPAMRLFDEATAQGLCLGVDSATGLVLEDLARREIPVVVWTVNEAARVRELLRAGVAGLISDLPSMAAHERRAVEAR
jgi:glycerophosphoryl diester phosphodiesterase